MIKLLVFTADWCTFCKRLKPYTDALIESHTVYMRYVDVDTESTLTDHFGVKTIPCVVAVHPDGTEDDRVVNPNPKQLKDFWEVYRGEV